MSTALTKKQKGFVRDYVKTGNGTQSALKHYDTKNENVARSIASENLTKPAVAKAIAARLPDDLLEEKHLALLNRLDDTGGIDVQAVAKGLDMAYKVKGSYAPEKNINLNIDVSNNVDDEVLDDLSNELETIRANKGTDKPSDGKEAQPVGGEVPDKDRDRKES